MKVDFQRRRLYNWELATDLYGGDALTLVNAEELIRHVWVQSTGNSTPPTLVYTPDATCGRAFGRHRIELHTRGLHIRYILHEVAHCLNAFWYEKDAAEDLRHGPRFVQLLIDLRIRYAGDEPHVLAQKALEHKLIVLGSEYVEGLNRDKNQETDPVARKRLRRQLRAAARKHLLEISAAGPGQVV